MTDQTKFYLLLTLLCLILQGTFAMLEMACVSFNKMRLQYYLSQGSKRAKWLSYLIHRPAWVFGTTLIGVNATMIIGSECSRRLYESWNLSPDLAPITQILIVLLFAEISPMLAGRKYAEHVGLLGAPFLMALSFLLRPVIFALDLLCRGINYLIGSPVESGSYLSREELQNIIEERDEPLVSSSKTEEFQTIVANIFSFKTKTAKDLMQPLTQVSSAPVFATVGEIRKELETKPFPFVILYQRTPQNVLSIAYPRDLLRLADQIKIKDHAKAPWFITESASILQILKQFRNNNQSVAVVLNSAGVVTGVLSLDEITDELFGLSGTFVPKDVGRSVVIDRTFPADYALEAFNQQFRTHLYYEGATTLGEVVALALGHMPEKGESAKVGEFELFVEEASLLGAKEILVRTRS